MRRPQFTLKTLLWLMAVVATVLTGWEAIDLAHEGVNTGEVPYAKLLWTGTAYLVAFVTLGIIRARA